MVNDNKILTVSYGTFSCTLEGFDDPFNTMRSISEYFRDLAAEDRYFGAEPPTPDPQMLHSIAEKEVQRLVEAKLENNGHGVVLRQLDADDQTDAPQHAAVTAPAGDKTPAQDDAAIKAAAQQKRKEKKQKQKRIEERKKNAALQAASQQKPAQEKPKLDPVTAAAATSASPSLADKLERIRAAVAHRSDSEFAEDQHAADNFATSTQDDHNLSYADLDTDLDTEFEETAIEAPFVEENSFDEDDFGAAFVEDVTIEDTADIMAEAVLPEAVDLNAIEDDVENDDLTIANILPALSADVMEDAADGTEAVDVDVDDILASLDNEADTSEADVSEVEDADLDDALEIDLTALASQVEDHADEQTLADAPAEPEIADAVEDTDDEELNLVADIAAMQEIEVEESTDAIEAETQDPIRRVRARVVKMRRSELDVEGNVLAAIVTETTDENTGEATADEETIAETPVEDDADLELSEKISRELGATSLDDDAEEDLMRELAEVAADVNNTIPAPEVADIDTAIAAPFDLEDHAETVDEVSNEFAISALLDDAETDDNAPEDADDYAENDMDASEEDDDASRNVFGTSDDQMSRIMDATDREMANGESTRRRNAIQHLKAAVGAVRADKTDDEPTEAQKDAQSANVYREDLARVVKPRRPTEGKPAAPRRLAPLMLVSEQRIDEVVTTASGVELTPVRPRRISASAVALEEAQQLEDEHELSIDAELGNENGGGFSDFAERLGVESLNELLEAAAAYSNYVEGNDTVTRPQIMRLAAQAMPEEAPVEERLRSFGQLLRQGKIKKKSRGHFVVDGATRFKPDAVVNG